MKSVILKKENYHQKFVVSGVIIQKTPAFVLVVITSKYKSEVKIEYSFAESSSFSSIPHTI